MAFTSMRVRRNGTFSGNFSRCIATCRYNTSASIQTQALRTAAAGIIPDRAALKNGCKTRKVL
jgi:hypothetical protein